MLTPAPHMASRPHGILEFNPGAVEILILDRRGGIVWKGSQSDLGSPIRWEGSDVRGDAVPEGAYTCKITYADAQIVYLPFVFIRPH